MASFHRKYPYGQCGSGTGPDFLPTPILLTGEKGAEWERDTATTLCKHCSLMDVILVVSTGLVTNPNHIMGAAMSKVYSISARVSTSYAVYFPQASSFPLMVSGCFSWLTAIHVVSGRES